MSVYFSKYCVNGCRDGTNGGDPYMRDRLLTAIKELAVLGQEQLQGLESNELKKSTRDDSLLGPRPIDLTHLPDNPKSCRSQPSQASSSLVSSLKQSSPHGVLKAKLKRSVTLKLEKGNIKVYANILHPDVQFKTLAITYETTSKEVVSRILEKYNAQDKDSNLYFVAMETGIKQKDSGLPISKMIVLEDNARPLELQACQPQGETKFHLRIKSGGVVRVRTSILCQEILYKTVYIARNTTSRQLIKLIIKGSRTDESDDNFILREASLDFDVDRIVQDDEYPLEIQANWKPDEGRLFFLTRLIKKPESNPIQSPPEPKSEELMNEIAKQNETIDVLNETIQKLQIQYGISKLPPLPSQEALSSTCPEQDQCKCRPVLRSPINKLRRSFDHYRRKSFNVKDLELDREAQINKLRRSLNDNRRKSFNVKDLELNKTSQIGKLRRSFDQYRRRSFDVKDLDLMYKAKENKTEDPSQIERFRSHFLSYYNAKSRRRLKKPNERSWSTSDADFFNIANDLDSLARAFEKSQKSITEEKSYPDSQDSALSRNSSFSSSCDEEVKKIFGDQHIYKQKQTVNCMTLFDVIYDMKLVSVTLTKEPGQDFGLELAHVTQTGSPIEDPLEVMYVFHQRDGNTAIVGSPSSVVGEDSPTIDYDVEIDEVFPKSPLELSQDSHVCFGSQNDDSPRQSQDSSTKSTDGCDRENLETKEPNGCCCRLAEWRDGQGPKPHHGVRIVGVTTGSTAEQAQNLEKDDIIVEVNGTNVLNSSLVVVIDTLRQHNTVNLVIAREKQLSLCHDDKVKESSKSPHLSQNEENVTQGSEEQVQELNAKLTEMKKSLEKKDKYICHLKKSLMKRKLKLSSKEKIVEAVQVIV